MTDIVHPVRMRALKLALFCGAAFAVQAPVHAQEADADGSTLQTTKSTVDGETVIIVTARNYVPEGSGTATKSDIPLIETPQSVSVITRDQIDLLGFIDVQQAARYSAGVVGENYGPDLRFDFLTVRGFTPIQYIDGLQAPISATIPSVGVDLYGFEAVDILKGPASVLYGSSPPGGIYNLTSRKPAFSQDGEIGVQYGSDDYKQVRGTVTGPLNDQIAARFTGLYLDRESQVDFVDANRVFVAPAVTLKPFDGTTITLLGYYQYEKVNGDTNGFLPAVGTLLPNPLGKIRRGTNLGEPDYNFYRRRQWGAGWQLSQEIANGWSFEQNLRWFDYGELQHVIYGGGGLDVDNRTVFRFNFPYKEDVQEFAVDNRIQGDLDLGMLKNKVTVGLDYRNFRNASFFGFAGASSIDLYNPVYSSTPIATPSFFPFANAKREQTGVYIQDQAKFGDFILTLSGRQDWLETLSRATSTKTKDDKFTYRVGATYLIGGFAPYVSYATSFVPQAGQDRNGNLFVPSVGKQIEGGIKFEQGRMRDPVRIFATLAAFQIKQDNIPVLDTSPGAGPFDQVQLGGVKVKGIELEGVARFNDQLSINGSYSYTDAKISKSTVVTDIGLRLPTQPKHKLSLFADYTLQAGALGGLGFGFGGRYLSSSYGDNANVYKMPSTTLFDAILHYDLPGWRFAVNGSNIFDKVYVGRCAGPANCIYGQARQVIGTVTKKF
ncbi:MAG: TonB-dependent siderophore receptor [Sphingobium sp.]